MRALFVIAATLAALASAPTADAADDVRVRGACSGPTQIRLRVRADEGRLRVELELANRGPASRWRVVILRERRLMWQGTLRTGRGSTARVRRTYADWFGTETVSVRAVARRGDACRASATV